jgi:hypothetical protein
MNAIKQNESSEMKIRNFVKEQYEKTLELRRHSQLLPKIDKEIHFEVNLGKPFAKIGSMEKIGL